METKTNYALVGAFVMILSAFLFAIILWLTTGFSDKRYLTYLAVMKESVSGLSLKAPVKYNGVDVGHVERIKLDPHNPKNVLLFLEIEQEVKIHSDAVATIDSSGLTGIAYVGLRGGSPGAPLLKRKPGQHYAIINTQPSLLVRVDTAVRKLSEDLDSITQSVHQVLSDENQRAFSQILMNLQKTTAVFAQNSDKLASVMNHTDTLIQRLDSLSKRFPTLLTHADKTFLAVTSMSHEVKKTGKAMRKAMKKSQVALTTISEQVVPATANTLEQVSSLSEEMQHLTQQLQRNPSMLVRGKHPHPLAPGER